LVIFLLACVLGIEGQNIPNGRSSHTLTHGGRDRTFIIQRPANIGTNPTALVFIFHGFTNTATSVCTQAAVDSVSALRGFLAVCPQGVSNSWNAAACCGTAQFQNIDDVGFARAMVEYIRRSGFPIDPNRILATGFSNGGMLSYRIACQASDVFTGAGISGGQYYGDDIIRYECTPARPRPAVHLHGTLDIVIGFTPASNSHNRYATNIVRCPTQTRDIARDPNYFNMVCTERVPGGACLSPGAAFCTYTGFGHSWPVNGLTRMFDYLTRGVMPAMPVDMNVSAPIEIDEGDLNVTTA